MMTGGLIEEFRPMQNSAAFGILRREYHPPDSRHSDGTRAHRARLQRDVERRPGQPLIAEACGSPSDHFHLGMGRGVFARDNPVAILGQQAAISRQKHRPDRHFTTLSSRFGFRERQCYGLFVIHGRSLRGQN